MKALACSPAKADAPLNRSATGKTQIIVSFNSPAKNNLQRQKSLYRIVPYMGLASEKKGL
jgi:hypothetical protein